MLKCHTKKYVSSTNRMHARILISMMQISYVYVISDINRGLSAFYIFYNTTIQ